jgi:hypothetical protein
MSAVRWRRSFIIVVALQDFFRLFFLLRATFFKKLFVFLLFKENRYPLGHITVLFWLLEYSFLRYGAHGASLSSVCRSGRR